jgi:alpha-glucoside transport system permease protein
MAETTRSTTAEAAAPPARGVRPAVADFFKRLAPRLPLHLVLIGLMVLWSIPTIALFISSFREPAAILSTGWWTAFTDMFRGSFDFTFSNYDTVITRRGMGRSFLNSIIITVPATILVIIVAAFAAYAFAWMRFPGRNVLFLIVVALLVVPLQMTLIPILRMYVDLGNNVPFITNELPLLGGRIFGTRSYAGLWVAHTAFGLPFAVFLLRNFFGQLPRDLFESAYLDGASELRVFFRIVLPLSMPAIAALAIFQFLWVWQDLLVALVLLGDPDLAPMMLTINSLVSSFGAQYQLLTAAAFLSMIVPLIIFFALQRYFVQGILAGAVKG